MNRVMWRNGLTLDLNENDKKIETNFRKYKAIIQDLFAILKCLKQQNKSL